MIIKQCNRCLMDETAEAIKFDYRGFCNYCLQFEQKKKISENKSFHYNIDKLLNKVKLNSKKYDCVIGLSGGVDSSYALAKCIELGLKPLAVHMDNGWNSSLAQNNIMNLVKRLEVDLITYVINWKEYRSLMNSFFNSNVIDIELLYDHAMLAVNYKIAYKYKIKYIFAGTNQNTEGFEMPKNWNWFKYDKKNIIAINKKFENYKIHTFPFISIYEYIYFKIFKKIEWVSILDFLNYNKDEAQTYLEKNFKFQPYPYKHYESVFTRFYQGYILPKKFNVDKRKIHLSNLILSGQITKNQAHKIMLTNPYQSGLELRNDINFFLKKMNWTNKMLDTYLNCKEVKHNFYPNDYKLWNKMRLIRNFFK